jgi:biotin-(acetyl-CoA carboxylase) ligase
MTWWLSDADPGAEPLREWIGHGRESRRVSAAASSLWSALCAPPNRSWRREIPSFKADAAVAVVEDAAGSQFDALLTWLRQGNACERPVVAIALAGRGFHGYRNRPWTALRGNLHLSAAFPVGRALGPDAVALTAIPAVAVLDALKPWRGSGFQPGIKWVNDVLVEGRKISGVITSTQSRGAVTSHVVFGIGLNVSDAPPLEPSVFVPRAGSLKDSLKGEAPSLALIFPRVASALARRFRQFCESGAAPILRAYRNGSMLTGRAVRVWEESTVNSLDDLRSAPPPRRGIVSDIGPDLSLILEEQSSPVSRGRLALEEVCQEMGLK